MPLNPERDGWHWVSLLGGKDNAQAMEWLGPEIGWDETDWTTEDFGLHARYLGPALTLAEVDARIATARKDALEEAARLARHYATIVPMHGSLKCDIYEAAGQAATEIAASIDALAEKELLSEDIIRADRDAWPDHQANDPVRALAKGEGDE
jgi:hypothetical protein